MHDFAHRNLGDLAADRPRNIVNLEDLRRNVPGRLLLAYPVAQLRPQLLVQGQPFAQTDEKYDTDVAFPLLSDADRFNDLVELFDDTVDLRRADAHAARIKHGVAAAIDDHPAVLGDFRVVAVVPDIFPEPLEVG